MADPKYADLPGIAYDQPDCYETSDLPESEQNVEFPEEDNDSIERGHLNANEAFNKFKGKFINADGIDFSDRLSRTLRNGYEARSGVLELVGRGENETPIQKYHRLQIEFKELLEDISNVKDKTKTEEDQDALSYPAFEKQVQKVQQSLNELRLEETLGSELLKTLTDPHGTQIKKILAQVDTFMKSGNETTYASTAPSIEAPAGVLSYQVQFRPEQVQLEQTQRIAVLEQRIHQLESLVGATPDKLSRLGRETQNSSLLAAAQTLSARAALLDPGQLDHIEGRLMALSQKMDSIASKSKEAQIDPEKEKKVNELYDLMKKIDSMSQELPNTVERMTALETLHNQTADFNKSLKQLEALQPQITNSLQKNKDILKEVENNFASNFNTMKNNMQKLDDRLAKLKK